jgi:hypothetical protein
MQFQFLPTNLKGKKMSKSNIIISIILSFIITNYAKASPVDALERERSKLLNHVLNTNISVKDRQQNLEKSKMKLLDLERITINNKNISKNPSYQTIKAFENFDLTFLVHASLEQEKSLPILWFEKVGLTTNNLMNTRVSRK